MNVRRIISFVILVIMILCSSFFAIPTYADDGSGIDDGGVFDEIGVKSYDCYYFDLEKLDILDTFYKAINAVGNLIWDIIKLLTKLLMMYMYAVLKFDASELLSPYISGIQSAFHESIFETLFVLMFCGTAVILLKRMFVRDLMGAFGDIVKVVVIVVLSIALVKKSDSAVSLISNVTKQVSIEIMMGINDSTGDDTGMGSVSDDASTALTDFALGAAEILWKNLVDEPWQYLEFAGTDPSEEDIENFLNIANQPGSDNRASLVANYKGAAVCFAKDRALTRLACLIVYLETFIMKFILYGTVIGIQTIMQVITVVYILIAPVVLLLALLPGYEYVISTWLRKMLEAQLGLLISTFLLGIMINIDSLLYGKMDSMGGFLVIGILQQAIMMGIYNMSKLSTLQVAIRTVNKAKNRVMNDAGTTVRTVDRFMTGTNEKMKKIYDKHGYRDSYYQNIRYSEFDNLEDHQKTLRLDKQKGEKTRAELDAPARTEEDKYADAYDKGMRKNYYKKMGKEKYDRELMNKKYDDLEDYQKDYWKQLHNDDKNNAEETKKAPRLYSEETDRGGENIYAGFGETDGSKGPKRAIIKKKNSELQNGLPIRSEYPNVAVDNVADDGHVYQRRLYDENRMAEKDYDTDDHHRPKAHPTGAHKHIFQGEKRSEPQVLTEEELEENSDIIQRGVNYHDKE